MAKVNFDLLDEGKLDKIIADYLRNRELGNLMVGKGVPQNVLNRYCFREVLLKTQEDLQKQTRVTKELRKSI